MGQSRIPDGKTRVVVTLENDVVEMLDHIAGLAESNRSQVIGNLVEMSLEDLGVLAAIGLTPRRSVKMRSKLVNLGVVAPDESERLRKERDKAMKKARKRLGLDD